MEDYFDLKVLGKQFERRQAIAGERGDTWKIGAPRTCKLGPITLVKQVKKMPQFLGLAGTLSK